MERSLLIFENSPWLILICLGIGAGLTYLLYQRSGPWGRTAHYFLIAFRFLLISFLCFLLIGPIVKHLKNRIEKPQYVVALDNSISLSEVVPPDLLDQHVQQIKQLGQQLSNKGFAVEYRNLGETIETSQIDSMNFDHQSTSLSKLLNNIQTDYEGRNISGVILMSDGIHNQGLSPVYRPYKFPVYTIGIGDTIPQKDVILKAIHYNKIAYQGNKFILRAEILNDGFENNSIEVSVSEGGSVLQSKTLSLSSPPQLLETDFELEAGNQGLKDYIVTIKESEEEFSANNNVRHAYIEIIEGKRKILFASKNPHPDIKAIKNAIEKNQNYQLDLFIPGLNTIDPEIYDLIILHQISQQEVQRIPEIANQLVANTPIWTIIGNRSNLNRVNAENPMISIKTINFQRDQVTPSFNAAFSKYQISPELREMLTNYNPVNVPFANYEVSGGAEILLFQKVGNLVTGNPLLLMMDDGDQKSAIMVGEGMWQWRMQDYARNQNFDLFDEFVSKLVQYLSSNEDKSRFKVYPLTQEFNVNEPAILETEVYNEIYEETYGHTIDLTIESSDGYNESFQYVTSQGNSSYKISELVPGIYTFKAKTLIDGVPATSQGQFTITEMKLESLVLTADHQLLRSLSLKTNGKFYGQQHWQELAEELTTEQAQGVIISEEVFTPLIRWPWALVVLLVLVSLEWFLRKYHGTY
jgi:hypothetical protein